MSDISHASAPLGAASKAAAAGLKKNQPAKPDKPTDTRSHEQIQKDVVKNRQDLAETLDAIEYKLNVPKQATMAARRVKAKIKTLREENPAVLVAGAAGAAAVVGTGIWLGVRALTRR
ncbi:MULTISPECIES: DUF3618 domain-containing protein [Subtercola]|uniref:DUF3618 domain-containing protein n=1 Tax=Subtercola vilae TaxID=2056433 RepID=A0A4T2BTI2_9MICO|nr:MULTISPECIES: DUF3618 domain-containing protein [Subtercola]MEA9986120.1 DUF3618 domain-containing protein [Subtercola sp. RTI3]TIH33751.1 DUF3618 domain-containing protein [Subtercola vilae]